MRAASHKQLGMYLAKHYMPHLPRKYLQVFLIGCTQPDKNPATYLKGSVHNRLLRGHDYTSARRYMFRLARSLQQRENWRVLDYYKLGKLIHYTADAFTSAHNADFTGDFSAHRRYEQLLQKHFLQRLEEKPNICPKIHSCPAQTIHYYHRLYCKSPTGICTDIDFCIGVSSLVMQLLTCPAGMEIFSI